MRKVELGIVIAVAIALVIRFAPLVQAEHRYTETYYENEPYQAVETYSEPELMPEVEVIEHHMDIEGDVLWIRGQVVNGSNATFATSDVSIQATCPVQGVEGSYIGKSVVLDYPVAFKPGEARDFAAAFDRNLVEDSYTIKIYQPLAEVLVEKERTVTKYRQAERERLVIEYERVPIFEYLRSKL